jgi:hypothetical protein
MLPESLKALKKEIFYNIWVLLSKRICKVIVTLAADFRKNPAN